MSWAVFGFGLKFDHVINYSCMNLVIYLDKESGQLLICLVVPVVVGERVIAYHRGQVKELRQLKLDL